MKIHVGAVYSTVEHATLPSVRVIKSVCKAKPSGYQFSPKFKKGRWDGFITLMPSSTKFPTGLLGAVVRALRKAGYKITLNWNGFHDNIRYDTQPDILIGITLRDYQIEASNILLNAGRGIAKMATNSGKTEVIAAMIATAGLSALILVHRKELLYQTAARLESRLGQSVGVIGDGKVDIQNVTVAMIQTVSKKGEKWLLSHLAHVDGIFVDECHHGSASQYMDVLAWFDNVFMRWGFSGTPLVRDELNDLKLIAFTGKVLYEINNEELIERGFSAKPTIVMYTVRSLYEDEWEMKYSDAYREFIVENNERNTIIASLANTHTKDVVLILVKQVKHGYILQKMIPGSHYIHGSDTTDKRQMVLGFMKEETGVYIATTIVDEGVDIPAVNVLILAGGGKSERAILQRIGRGLRQKDGDNTLLVYDIVDDTNKHLYSHYQNRVEVYQQEGFDVETVDEILR